MVTGSVNGKNICLYTPFSFCSFWALFKTSAQKEGGEEITVLANKSNKITHVWESEDELVSLKSADLQKPLCGAGRQNNSSELVTHRYN